MPEINSFPIQTKQVIDLDDLTNDQSTSSDKVIIYDESVSVWKSQTLGELFKGKVIPIDSIADFPNLDTDSYSDRQQFSLGSFAPDGESGGGIMLWQPSLPKSLHDGINYFSPTVPIPADFNNPTDVQNYLDGVGEEWPAGDGIFVLNYFVSREEFEAVENRQFDTPAQAALASLPVGAKFSTKGCLSTGDGGHGDFIASATAPTTEDGYSCFEHANGTFGVLQPVNGEFNLLQFGAAGNGTTDDTAAIRRANAFMKARGGGVLNFLDRPYKVKRTSKSGESGTTPDDYIILVDYSEITFKGVKGKTKIIHDITDTDFTFMRIGVLPIANGVVSLHDVVLKDMEIDGGYDPVEGTEDGGSALIIAYGVKRFKFTGLYLHRGKDYGIGLQNGGHQDGLIEDCVIEDTGADGIDHKNNGDVSEGNVINNVIVRRFGRHESPSAPYAGVDLMYGWQVSNLLVEEFGAFGTAGAALRLKQGESAEPRGRGGNDTNVVNFKAYAKETPNEALLYLDGIRCSARNCNISNVVVEGVVGAGVRFQQRKNRLTNANCKNGGTGYILEDASYTTEADDCTLVNCDAEGNDVGYRIETDGTKLSNCTGESNGHTFSFPSVASNTTITGGASLTPTIGHIQNTGSSTVRVVEVDGFITSNTVESAPFSITSAGTFNVVVPHGLPFDFDERFASVSVRRSSNIANWTVTRLVLVSVTSTDATYQITIGTPSGTGGDTATLLCRFEPRYIASSI